MKKTQLFYFLLLTLFSSSTYAGNCVSSPLLCPPLNLQQMPILLIDGNPDPNVMFLLNDSLSMGDPIIDGGEYGSYQQNFVIGQRAIISIINAYPNSRYGFEVFLGGDSRSEGTPTFNFTDKVTQRFIAIPSGIFDYTAHNNKIINTVLNLPTSFYFAGTPARAALTRIGNYYQGAIKGFASPIISKCQKNYVIFLTDGEWTDEAFNSSFSPSMLSPSLASNSNADIRAGDIDHDKKALYVADIARYFYVNNLSSSIQGPNKGDPYGVNADDPSWQYNMRIFAVPIRVLPARPAPTLKADQDGWPTPALRVNSPEWGASKVDDLWHAAFNTKGKFVNPRPTSTLLSELGFIFNDVIAANYSAGSAAQNSTLLNAGAMLYQASFNSRNWTGELYAYSINQNGIINSKPTWSASCVLTGGTCTNPSGQNAGKAYNKRVIIARDFCDNSGASFAWPTNYTTSTQNRYPNCDGMINLMAGAPYPVTTTNTSEIQANNTYGQRLVNYIRGDSTYELKNQNGNFRNRDSKLGDIINSSPVYVGAPTGTYSDSSETAAYSEFKKTNLSRQPMLYVNANDGMLHGFNAKTGEELLGYVPGDSQLLKNLGELTKISYKHRFLADATPVVGDAFFNSSWHTILASSLGNGGKSIFALDITNPQNFVETKSKSIYLFEFSNKDNEDVGYIQGTPIIAKVKKDANSHQWAIIFGNGYNSSSPTTGSGKAALYILFIQPALSGTKVIWTADKNFIKIPVGTGDRNNPNGLSTPYAIDKNEDGMMDYVYAGDLQGNLWRFDLTDPDPTKWKSAASLLFSAQKTKSGDQPITAPPVVGPHPSGISNGVIVYFGTGKFLEPTDNSQTNQTTQTFYGIWDKLNTKSSSPIVSKSNLLAQKILGTQKRNTGLYRLVSNNTIDWKTQQGWYIDLLDISQASNAGERQISMPILHDGKIIFSTLIPPAAVDPSQGKVCEISIIGSSWLMELDSNTGGAPLNPTFDTNGDGKYGNGDAISVGSNTGYASGYQSTVGITGSPTIFLSEDGKSETKVLSGSGLGTVQEAVAPAPTNATPSRRRENWIQIH